MGKNRVKKSELPFEGKKSHTVLTGYVVTILQLLLGV